MKLMKLLTVGRSLNGGKPVSGQYKVQQILLPKFASSVRPSRTAIAARRIAVTPTATPVPASTVARAVAPAIERSIEPATLGMDKTQKIPAGKILKRKPEPTGLSLKVKVVTLLQKQIAAVKKRLIPARSKKKSGATPTQTEWNLEKVTVARNDLSEADLEIMMPKSAGTAPSRKTHLPNLSSVKNTSYKWIKRTSQLFKPSSPFAASAAEKQTKEAGRRELVEKI